MSKGIVLNRGVIVLSVVLAVLLCLESALRLVERRLSGNINHIYEIGEIADSMRGDADTIRLLFLGNSLINEAVDPDLLTKLLGRRVEVYKVTPDGTTIWDWYFIVRNQFFDRGIYPDYLIIGFAWGLLSDRAEREAAELAAHFTRLKDVPTLIHFGLEGIPEICEYLLGKVSRLFVYREMIRNRLLASWIPNYERYVQQANSLENERNRPAADDFDADDFKLLRALIEQAGELPVKVLFAAMPVQNEYDIPAYARDNLFHTGNFIDLRGLFPGNQAVYKDAIHLNGDGRQVVTEYLATTLTPLITGGK